MNTSYMLDIIGDFYDGIIVTFVRELRNAIVADTDMGTVYLRAIGDRVELRRVVANTLVDYVSVAL